MIFEQGSVPINIVAKVYGKDCSWVRAGLITGYLPIGFATRNGQRIISVKDISSKRGRINYYVSPKLLYEQTGYLYHRIKNKLLYGEVRNC